ncbi:MAG: D-aminoacyl-tRNA deacylase [Gammaproteobacteria bacterium]|nr:D-aminoacyl-tRNA deacylase [Gammaproteobacteria bacterium]
MIALIQRVTRASVTVDKQTVGEIDQGILALIGVERDDTASSAERLLERIVSYRIFEDNSGKMNVSLADIKGGLLLVPQFTLAADTNSGKRPSFSSAAPPAEGERQFDVMVAKARETFPNVATGIFGTDMQVSLVNDGPVTFWLQVKP